MRSMTGYGSGESTLNGGTVRVELRAVNHRFLDLRIRAPTALCDHAGAIEEVLRARCDRGRIEANVEIEGSQIAPLELDSSRAERAFRDLLELRDELAPEEKVPLSLLATIPDLFRAGSGPPDEEKRSALRGAAEAACEELEAMRMREGRALRTAMEALTAAVREHVAAIRTRCPAAVAAQRERLTERIERLLESLDVDLDQDRLVHELAILADKSDITEELDRLDAHLEQLDLLFEAEGAVGRKMDFLLQEIGREVNTIGSKSSDAELTRDVVALKAELERIREQVQNVL